MNYPEGIRTPPKTVASEEESRRLAHRNRSVHNKVHEDSEHQATQSHRAQQIYGGVINEADPIARLYGEPLLELPSDLYIPPDALRVFLEKFEGPLDLLLYLIRKHNFDVLDIPVAEVTRQYMEYIQLMHAHQLELAAEYLLMAALLIEIKSRMLLPARIQHTDDEKDPRAELTRRLLEYEQMKRAAQRIDALPHAGRDFSIAQVWVEQVATRLLPEVHAEDLKTAWLALLARAHNRRHHRVQREGLSVRAQMSRILRRLRDAEFVEFSSLFEPNYGVAELVVSLLAILELIRERLIEASQQQAFAPIYIRRVNDEH